MRPVNVPGKPRRGLILAGIALLGGVSVMAVPHARPAQDPPKEQDPAIRFAVRGTKLILKDGRFHLVRNYERKGDRVRYYSVERSAWEELPADLVDWEATRKAEEAIVQKEQELLEKARDSEIAVQASEIDVDASIEYAPGHFLPDGEGFYAVEGTTIVPLPSVGADVKLDKGRLLTQILVPVPVIPSRHRIRVAGKSAAVRLTTGQPEFYFRTPDAREPEIEFLRAEVKRDYREVQVVETSFVGDKRRRGQLVAVERWKVARGVYRFTLGEALPPGEYAVAEYIPGGEMSFYLWEFGVDRRP